MFSGYAFWFVMSRLTTSDIIGTASTLVSLATIFSVVAIIGVPTGVQRFLAKIFSEQKIQDARVFIRASLVLVTIGILSCSIAILIIQDVFHDVFKIDQSLVLVFVVLIAASSTFNLFRSIIISSLKTKMLPIITVVAVSFKIGLGIILVLIGTGALGITIGFTLFPILGSILLFVALITILGKSNVKPETKLKQSIKDTLSASLANWFPALINTFGSQLGTVVVFGTKGASHAGVYFIAFSVFSAIFAVTSVLLSIAYPALSAMSDGRKRFAWRMIKMSLVVTLPIASSLIFYAREIMQLFGQGYVDGAFALQILLLSSLPAVIVSGVNSLVYSQGNYRRVLVIGLASSIPRVLLYFIVVPLYGSIGAALSFTLGSIIGFVVSIIFARAIGLQIFWRELLLVQIIPVGLGFVLKYMEINYVAGILITIITSYILFLKMRIISRVDIQDSIGILPAKIASPTLRIINAVAKKLDRQY
ncbi:MAG: hypothetical protein ACRD9Q_00295 [Nitrososphaeraceae archaeon]